MADTHDSKSCGATHVGSTPTSGINYDVRFLAPYHPKRVRNGAGVSRGITSNSETLEDSAAWRDDQRLLDELDSIRILAYNNQHNSTILFSIAG